MMLPDGDRYNAAFLTHSNILLEPSANRVFRFMAGNFSLFNAPRIFLKILLTICIFGITKPDSINESTSYDCFWYSNAALNFL